MQSLHSSSYCGYHDHILYMYTAHCFVGCSYVILYNKGYQEFEDVESAATTKLKGVAYTDMSLHVPQVAGRTWDVADYVIPPQVRCSQQQ